MEKIKVISVLFALSATVAAMAIFCILFQFDIHQIFKWGFSGPLMFIFVFFMGCGFPVYWLCRALLQYKLKKMNARTSYY